MLLLSASPSRCASQPMGHDHSRLSANLGAFPSQLAEVCKVYLVAASLPRLWEMGCLCYCTPAPCLSAVIQCRDLNSAQPFSNIMRGLMQDFWFVFLLLETLLAIMTPESMKGSVCFCHCFFLFVFLPLFGSSL